MAHRLDIVPVRANDQGLHGTGHIGRHLPNAPSATGSFNVYVKNLGPWNSGLEYRYLGRESLSSDLHVHPPEPLAVRLALSKTF